MVKPANPDVGDLKLYDLLVRERDPVPPQDLGVPRGTPKPAQEASPGNDYFKRARAEACQSTHRPAKVPQ